MYLLVALATWRQSLHRYHLLLTAGTANTAFEYDTIPSLSKLNFGLANYVLNVLRIVYLYRGAAHRAAHNTFGTHANEWPALDTSRRKATCNQ